MPEIICDTSPLQYLHQLEVLDFVKTLVGQLTLPSAVVAELEEGRARGVDLPNPRELNWVTIRTPLSSAATRW